MLVKIITIILIVFVTAAIFMLWEVKRELNKFQTVHYEIQSSKLQGMHEKTIVFLSDLHNHVYGNKNDELLQKIIEAKPDFILIGGDMLISSNKKSYLPALDFVKQITSVCPVYYANGNHEQRLKERMEIYHASFAAYRRILEEAGVVFLENDLHLFDWEGQKVKLRGLEIPLTCYKHFGSDSLKQEDIEDKIGIKSDDCYEILMAHNPCFMKQYVKWGADLVLSGHLHGGIIRLPFIGGVIAPNFNVFPKFSGGFYQAKDTQIVVSKGLGTHTINIRLWNPAELVVLHIKGTLV